MDEKEEVLSTLFNSPDSLFDQCLSTIVNNLKCIIGTNSVQALPSQISDRLMDLYQQKNGVLDDNILEIFSNSQIIKLKRIFLRGFEGKNTQKLFLLLNHNLKELLIDDICGHCLWTEDIENFLQHINANGSQLEVFSCSGIMTENFFMTVLKQENERNIFQSSECILQAPNLKELVVRNLTQVFPSLFVTKLINPLKKLTKLDLSFCKCEIDFSCFLAINDLEALTLHGVQLKNKDVFEYIIKLKQLQHLDISQMSIEKSEDEINLSILIESLPNLMYLDISRTKTSVHSDDEVIEALKSRANNLLQFLGLYGTYRGACRASKIPANKLSGSANLEQLLNATWANIERPEMICLIFEDLMEIYEGYHNCDTNRIFSTLDLIFKAIDRHTADRFVTRCGITIDAFTKHKMSLGDSIVFFDIIQPNILPFCIEPVMEFVIYMIRNHMDNRNVRSLVVTLLKMVVYYDQKFIESYNLVKELMKPIESRNSYCAWAFVSDFVCDDIVNGQKFLDGGGVDLFINNAKSIFKESRPDLSVIVPSILQNLAQFESFVPYFMKENFLTFLLEQLNYDFTHEHSLCKDKWKYMNFHIGGVLVQLLAHGPEMWTVKEPKREVIIKNILSFVEKFQKFDDNYHKNHRMNLELLKPTLKLYMADHTLACKYWAIWSLNKFAQETGGNFHHIGGAEEMHSLKQFISRGNAPKYIIWQAKILCQRMETYIELTKTATGQEDNKVAINHHKEIFKRLLYM